MLCYPPSSISELTHGMWVKEFSQAAASDEADRDFATRCLMAPHTDACFALVRGGKFVSFTSVRFSERARKNAWGVYLDWHIVYTPPALRRRHYATELWLGVKQIAIERGHDRVKSIAKGKLGYYLHRSLGHQFWGWDRGGRGLVVDSPLVSSLFPSGIPIEARCAIDARLMSTDEMKQAEEILL